MDIGEYQRIAAASDVLPPDDLTLTLLGLAGEVGNLAAEYKKHQRDTVGYRAFRDEVREELGDLIWYSAALARRCDLDLSEILAENLRKTQQRFNRPAAPPAHALFDENVLPEQQLPRQLDITFAETIETEGGAKPVPVVRIYRGTQRVGDPLDDNRDDNDDYRYHDALHLAHMAVLGWSPTLRRLLRAKRKGDRDTDRIEDGGRSSALEEGLTAYVFSVATQHSLFVNSKQIPADLIKTCQRMTNHLEVAARTPADWEYAILAGYSVFRQLQRHHGGTVHADLLARTLTFTPPNTDVGAGPR